MSTLMEDLIVLAVGLKPKAGPNTGVFPPQFRFGVRGGELVMLTMAGRVTVVNGRIEVRDPAPLADPALSIVLSRLVASGGIGLKRWIVDPPPAYIISYFDRLRAAGTVREVQVKKLFSAKHTGYLIVDQAYFRDVRTRLHEAVTGPIDAAHAALAGVVYAAGMAELAYPGPENAAARDRLKQLAGASPASGASPAAAGRRSTFRPTASAWPRSRRPCGPPPRPQCMRLPPRSTTCSMLSRTRAHPYTTPADQVP